MSGESALCCPVCKARFRGDQQCSRCGADLTAPMLLAAGGTRVCFAPSGPPSAAIGRWADRPRVSPRCPRPALDARRRSSSVCECACQRFRNEGQRSPDPSARKQGRKRADLRLERNQRP
jgi:hypothetical protein